MHKRLLFVTALAALTSACAWAADDPFVGTWKGSRVDTAGQVQEIKHLGGDKYDWAYGDNHLELMIDGTDHPSKFGGTYSVREESPDTWVITFKHDGQVTSVNTFTLSNNGRELNAEVKGTHADGSPYTVHRTSTRVGAGSGFAGKWQVEETKFSSVPTLIIKPYGNDGLSFAWPQDKEHDDVTFDGKDYPNHGPRVPAGSVTSGKRIDERTIQTSDKLHGKVTGTQEWKISDDGRTLTDTMRVQGEQRPVIAVYEKQM